MVLKTSPLPPSACHFIAVTLFKSVSHLCILSHDNIVILSDDTNGVGRANLTPLICLLLHHHQVTAARVSPIIAITVITSLPILTSPSPMVIHHIYHHHQVSALLLFHHHQVTAARVSPIWLELALLLEWSIPLVNAQNRGCRNSVWHSLICLLLCNVCIWNCESVFKISGGWVHFLFYIFYFPLYVGWMGRSPQLSSHLILLNARTVLCQPVFPSGCFFTGGLCSLQHQL